MDTPNQSVIAASPSLTPDCLCLANLAGLDPYKEAAQRAS